MLYRALGHTDLKPSVISFGTWGIGGPPFWTPVKDDDAIRAIHAALDLGVNCIDTAPVYGLGHAESIVGKALEGRRDGVIVATKVGQNWRGIRTKDIYNDLSPASMRRELEASLMRLDTDVIDLYQVHWPDPKTPIAETFSTLAEFQKEGKIRHIGVSNYTTAMIDEAARYTTIVSLQPRYNLLDRFIEKELQPYCVERGLGILPYSPLASGLLTGKYTMNSRFSDWRGAFGDQYRAETFEKNLAVVDRLRPIAADLDISLGALSIAWVLARPGVTSALVGANSEEQVRENVKAAEVRLDEETIRRIEEALPSERVII
ncbi:MAG: aldo/keto reductase [Ignavibacteria bacterium]|nr:aldo/keto reductase [Ignavibacteria bacterium]